MSRYLDRILYEPILRHAPKSDLERWCLLDASPLQETIQRTCDDLTERIRKEEMMANHVYTGLGNYAIVPNPKIKRVIFNDPATIVFWNDGTKTVVKCMEGDTYSPEVGLAMCISKKMLGDKFHWTFNHYIHKPTPKYKYKVGDRVVFLNSKGNKEVGTIVLNDNSSRMPYLTKTDDGCGYYLHNDAKLFKNKRWYILGLAKE